MAVGERHLDVGPRVGPELYITKSDLVDLVGLHPAGIDHTEDVLAQIVTGIAKSIKEHPILQSVYLANHTTRLDAEQEAKNISNALGKLHSIRYYIEQSNDASRTATVKAVGESLLLRIGVLYDYLLSLNLLQENLEQLHALETVEATDDILAELASVIPRGLVTAKRVGELKSEIDQLDQLVCETRELLGEQVSTLKYLAMQDL